MKTQDALFEKHLDKAQGLNQQRKERPLNSFGCLEMFFSHYTNISSSFNQGSATKAHVIGLKAALSHFTNPNSALSLLSPGFERMAEALARHLLKMSHKKMRPEKLEYLTHLIELSTLLTIGLLELAKEKGKSSEDREELLIHLLFYSDYPSLYFTQIGEALGIDEKEKNLFRAILELFTLSVAIVSASSDEVFKKSLLEGLENRLESSFRTVIDRLEPSEGLGYLEQLYLALQKGEFENFRLALKDLLNEISYPMESALKDVEEIKKLFKRFKNAYLAANESSTNQVHMIG